MRKKSKVTSVDIAHRAGVENTVSRVPQRQHAGELRKTRAVEAVVNSTVDRHASEPAHAAFGHAGAVAVRRPDRRRLAYQPVFPVDARIDHACPFAAWFRSAGVVPAEAHDWHADYEDAFAAADGLILLGYGLRDLSFKLAKLIEQGTHFVRQRGVAGRRRTSPSAATTCMAVSLLASTAVLDAGALRSCHASARSPESSCTLRRV
jgi:alanine racemase